MYQAVAEEEIDAVGPENDRVIRDAVTDADLVVVAWGNTNKNRTGSLKSPARYCAHPWS